MTNWLEINGVDTSNLFVVEDWSNLSSAGPFTGGNWDGPGIDGERYHAKTRAAFNASVRVAILPDDPETGETPRAELDRIAQFNANWETIKRLVKSRRAPILLRRGILQPDGSEEIVTAYAEHSESLDRVQIGPSAARAVLSLRILGGAWYSETYSVYTVVAGQPTFIPVHGSLDTAEILVKLTGATIGQTQTLTNLTAGVTMSYSLNGVSADRVDVDVQKFAVTRTLSGTTVSSLTRLTHTGDSKFMILDPALGANEMTLNVGTAVISYKGAW